MALRHLVINKMTAESLRFGNTLMSASYTTFLRCAPTTKYDPRAPSLSAVGEERRILCNDEEPSEMRKDAKNKDEHFCP